MVTRKRSRSRSRKRSRSNLKYIVVDKTKIDAKLLNKIIKTHDQIFLDHYSRYDREFWKLLIEKSQYIELVYGPRSKLIGHILTLNKIQDVIPNDKNKYKNVLSYIAILGVDTKYRNTGIGHNLLKNLSEYLANKVTKTKYNIILDVMSYNEKGINFYEKNGYSILKKKDHTTANGIISQYIMKKKLTSSMYRKPKVLVKQGPSF